MPGRQPNHLTRIFCLAYKASGLKSISLKQLSPDAAQKLRAQQIRETIDQMRVFVIGNSVFAPILGAQAWNIGLNGVVLGWCASMLVFSWWLYAKWFKTYETDGSAADMNMFVAETRLNALLWCLGMLLFYPFVEVEGKTVLTIIMTGSLALGTVGFSHAPKAAFWYLAIMAFFLVSVPLVTGILQDNPQDLLISALALFAAGAVFNATLEQAKSQMRAFTNHEALSRKTEVIDLLLKDYEEQGIEWLWQTDKNGRLLNGPEPVLTLMNQSDTEHSDIDLLAAISENVDSSGLKGIEHLTTAFQQRKEFHEVTLPFSDPERGSLRWIMMRGRPQFEKDQFSGFRGIFADDTKAVEARNTASFLASHDVLTEVYNRNSVQQSLTRLMPDKDRVVVYLVDLDGFKQVNDSYGHPTGDKLLQDLSQRLLSAVRPDDMVARLGGDEFIVLRPVDDQHTPGGEDIFARNLLDLIAQPFLIDQYDIALSASIGTAMFPNDTRQGTSLLNIADLALYAAKNSGRNRYCHFVPEMQVGMQQRLKVTERLRKAVLADEIELHYQPQYCVRSGALVGFEALARWSDRELGRVGPGIFIPIAEETGLIQQLGEQLLRRACRDALTWETMGIPETTVVSVNLSPVQVARGNVENLVKSALSDTGLPPERLEIEVTEGVLIHDIKATRDVLKGLSDLGIRVALDDFGTGYSSLSYIRALPLNRLKIDRSFVSDLENPDTRAIVQTIIDLCSTLGLSVIAEGVENRECLALLRDMRCEIAQGYLFSAAVPADELGQLANPAKLDMPEDRTHIKGAAS